jgi:hypothetical protein
LHLGTEASQRVQAIYANASTSLKVPAHLAKLVEDLDGLDWYEAKEEGLGDLYEGLLEKNANEKKSGAGQYFTPRPLIDSMVRLVKPQPGELVQDPAAGTCGFSDRGRSLHQGRDQPTSSTSCRAAAGLPEASKRSTASSWCTTRTAWR